MGVDAVTKAQKAFCETHDLTEGQFCGREPVGGNLYLESVTEIPEGFNPTVAGSLYLGRGLTAPTRRPPAILTWQGGKYVSADGTFTEVVKRRGNVYHVRRIDSDKVVFLVTDGTFCAHGDTLKEAKAELTFKLTQHALETEPIGPDTIVTVDRYRAVTGACRAGVEMWARDTFGAEADALLENGIAAKDLLPRLRESGAYGLVQFESACEGWTL